MATTARLCIGLLVVGANSAAIRIGLPARSRRRAPTPAATGAGAAREFAAQLEHTYRTSGVQREIDAAGEPGSLLDVPLICHRWVGALPGVLQSLHISDPSLVHVFQSLAAEDHGRFGYFEGADRQHSPYIALSGPGESRSARRMVGMAQFRAHGLVMVAGWLWGMGCDRQPGSLPAILVDSDQRDRPVAHSLAAPPGRRRWSLADLAAQWRVRCCLEFPRRTFMSSAKAPGSLAAS